MSESPFKSATPDELKDRWMELIIEEIGVIKRIISELKLEDPLKMGSLSASIKSLIMYHDVLRDQKDLKEHFGEDMTKLLEDLGSFRDTLKSRYDALIAEFESSNTLDDLYDRVFDKYEKLRDLR